MTIRKLNFTNRIRIQHSDAKIILFKEPDAPYPQFVADLKLERYDGLPENAGVVVEAYRHTWFMKFPFGTLKNIKPPSNTSLERFDSIEGIKFRVKVIQLTHPGKGHLYAEADRISCRKKDCKEETVMPLLPVKQADLGDRVFNISFCDIDDEVWLEINDSISDYDDLARTDEFMALVYPEALRQILTRVLFVEKVFDTDGEAWPNRWIKFAQLIRTDETLPSEDSSAEALLGWIDDTVDYFCRNQKKNLKNFISKWQEQENESSQVY